MKRILFIAAASFLLFSLFLSPPRAAAAEADEIFTAESLNNAALAEGYIALSLPAARPMLRVSRPSGLIRFPAGTPNRNLYMALRSEITKTANGTNDKQYDDDIGGMSTVFAIPAEAIFPKTSFSAEDLGMDSLFTEDGAVREDVEAAFLERVNAMRAEISFAEVAMCIVNDSPYELYWFGRTARTAGNTFQIAVQRGENPSLDLEGSYKVLFSVSADYAVSGATTAIGGTEYRTWIDTDRYGSVERAKRKISEIRDAVTGMSDEAKMAYFAEQICGLVSYNHAAEAEFKAGTREYGDPWQLVWVFDSRSPQQVVCEGYSKAFSYLCELCTTEAECILAWGTIPAGNHMWNIVRIHGHNYLADLTNYDLGYDVYLTGAEGSPADGYDTKAIRQYKYNREQTKRSDTELTIEKYSYNEWKEATSAAPKVSVSSTRTYPGYQIAIRAESGNGALPAERIILLRDGESETTEGDTALAEFTKDTEIRVCAVIGGETTPEAGPFSITVAAEPEHVFSLPVGVTIEEEAFAGTGAELIQVRGGEIAPGAFGEGTVLAVDEIGDWFESGYPFIIREDGIIRKDDIIREDAGEGAG